MNDGDNQLYCNIRAFIGLSLKYLLSTRLEMYGFVACILS